MTDEFEGQEFDFIEGPDLDAAIARDRSRADTPEMVAFRQFFDGLNSEFFNADEFMVLGPSHHSPGSACSGKNTTAPSELWDNVVPLVAAMNAIRSELGDSVRITNCYRGPSYNTCVGGVSGSQHLQFRAADWICSQGTSADWAAAAQKVRDQGVFLGGIGIYNSFVHVDVRGSNANWDNR